MLVAKLGSFRKLCDSFRRTKNMDMNLSHRQPTDGSDGRSSSSGLPLQGTWQLVWLESGMSCRLACRRFTVQAFQGSFVLSVNGAKRHGAAHILCM